MTARRDLAAGQVAGRFILPNVDLALRGSAGDLLGPPWLHQRHPERVDEGAVDRIAEGVLRLLGVPRPRRGRLATLPLPATDPW